jgi:UDP-glucuronate 4-epimerase
MSTNNSHHYLVTGAAGFIGFHLSLRLLEAGHTVTGLDNLNHYYDPGLKSGRLDILKKHKRFSFSRLDLADGEGMARLFENNAFDRVVNLAAQAGVRYSIENPMAYVESNLVGFAHLLEGCRHAKTPHFVYASSSSVYGLNAKVPFSEHAIADHQVSLYGATKRANELMAHSYSSLYGLPTTGLRFFTVYGPWGRPDMALFLFTRAIEAGEPIKVFNYGKHNRDFTYIDDIVEGVVNIAAKIPQGNPDWDAHNPDPGSSPAPYRVYNIGNSNPVKLDDYIGAIEKALGKKAIREELPLQPGDVPDTWADCSDLEKDFGYKPSTPVEEGINQFIAWYRDYYDV